jgi:hypothetical protein
MIDGIRFNDFQPLLGLELTRPLGNFLPYENSPEVVQSMSEGASVEAAQGKRVKDCKT